MKLLSTDLLKEYGFTEDLIKSNHIITVLTRDKVDIVLKDNHFYYSNMGIDYPLSDIAGLRKLYKELRSRELVPVRVD
ncbi:MAG: hypothetical protein V4580_18960 [Bacteroidota bacterium]